MNRAASTGVRLRHRALSLVPFLYTAMVAHYLWGCDDSTVRFALPFWLMILAAGSLSFAGRMWLRRVGAAVCLVYALALAFVGSVAVVGGWLMWELSGGDPRRLGGHPVHGPPPVFPVEGFVIWAVAVGVAAVSAYGAVRVLAAKSGDG
jgi:hypothetical protein